MEIYQPKGGMCATCVHKKEPCTHLDFSTMQIITVIKTDEGDFLNVVRCTEFKREKK